MLRVVPYGAFLLFFAAFIRLSQQSTDEKRPFRSNKINMIWMKAQNKMSAKKLSDLHGLLDVQDQDELSWKQKKADGKDEDGMLETKLRRNLIRILEKFGLAKHSDTVDKYLKMNEKIASGGKFSDQRLDSLWNAAHKQGDFSVQELEQLEEEFNHHKDKVAEYENLQRLLSKHDSISISDNTILSQTDLQDEQVDKLRKQMKEKHKEVYEDFIRLKKKVVGDAEQMLFEDDRVNDLWQKAQEEEFSPEELQSIKEELSHFDHKILKHKHYVEQARESEKLVQNGQSHLKRKHEELDKKAKDHGRWVKKMHKMMLSRVRKTEL